MTDAVDHTELVTELAHLLAADVLPDAVQRAGQRLFERLEANVSVVLAGPEEAAKEYLHDVLIAAQLPRTSCRLVRWGDDLAFDQADVCIWCTSDFGPQEETQWQQASNHLKDHSFLVAFTNVAPFDPAIPSRKLDHLADIAAEDFYRFAQVEFENRARPAPPKAVTVLLTEMTELVRLGVAADMDNAQIFLMTHQSKAPPRATQAPPQKADVSKPLTDVATPAPAAGTTDLYQEALSTMQAHLAGLEPFLEAQDDAAFREIVTICEATSVATADVLSGSDLADPDSQAIREDMLAAADAILLMSTEGGAAPAVSAVTTVLQLKREMELQIAC